MVERHAERDASTTVVADHGESVVAEPGHERDELGRHLPLGVALAPGPPAGASDAPYPCRLGCDDAAPPGGLPSRPPPSTRGSAGKQCSSRDRAVRRHRARRGSARRDRRGTWSAIRPPRAAVTDLSGSSLLSLHHQPARLDAPPRLRSCGTPWRGVLGPIFAIRDTSCGMKRTGAPAPGVPAFPRRPRGRSLPGRR